jgi:hypothetical protein
MPSVSIGGDSTESMMRVAKRIVVPAMKRIARIRTRKTADAVNVVVRNGWVEVRAGTPEGAWGWTPIQASMFDNNRRHPLFGDKHKWYHQGYFPITEMTEKLVIKLVEDEYVRDALPILLERRGL